MRAGVGIFFLELFAIFLGIYYTKGRYSLAYMGAGDIVVFTCFGMISCMMTEYVQTLTVSKELIYLSLIPAALSTAVLTANNLRDHLSDAKADKKTIVVRLGVGFGKFYYSSLILLAYLPLILIPGLSICWITFPLALFLIKGVFDAKWPIHYMPLLPKTVFLLTLYTGILCARLLLK